MTKPTTELLGKEVRAVWIAWAKEQPHPKESWLTPWEELTEAEKEVDRRIGSHLFLLGIDKSDNVRAELAVVMLGLSIEDFEAFLEKCSPLALKRILELLEPDTGDARLEALSKSARNIVLKILNPLKEVNG